MRYPRTIHPAEVARWLMLVSSRDDVSRETVGDDEQQARAFVADHVAAIAARDGLRPTPSIEQYRRGMMSGISLLDQHGQLVYSYLLVATTKHCRTCRCQGVDAVHEVP
jgi:hypothetical protein